MENCRGMPAGGRSAKKPAIAFCGLNKVGLQRRGFATDVVDSIHKAYRILYQNGKLLKERLEEAAQITPMTKEVEYIIDFVKTSKRGIIQPS